VPDLDKIVDLSAVGNFGGSHGGAVDACVGLDVDVAPDAHRAGLGNLLPGTVVVLGKAEAVRADNRAVFERDMVAESAAFADDGMGVGKEVIADRDAGIDHDMGQDGGVAADRARGVR
jgi:hypothetical protein